MSSIGSTLKICRECKETKLNSEFPKGKGYKLGTKLECKTCYNSKNRKYKMCPKKRKRLTLRDRYGISPEDLENMKISQKGKCYVCQTSSAKRLVIDHCHKTGKVRKLLCDPCNAFIGHIERSGESLHKYLDYIHKHSGGLSEFS